MLSTEMRKAAEHKVLETILFGDVDTKEGLKVAVPQIVNDLWNLWRPDTMTVPETNPTNAHEHTENCDWRKDEDSLSISELRSLRERHLAAEGKKLYDEAMANPKNAKLT